MVLLGCFDLPTPGIGDDALHFVRMSEGALRF